MDAPSQKVAARIPAAATRFAIDFSPDGSRAYVASSGFATVVSMDCLTRQIVAHGRTGRRPWLARITPDGKYLLVPNREDGTLQVFYAASLLPAATIPVAAGPEQVVVLPDSSVAFVS